MYSKFLSCMILRLFRIAIRVALAVQHSSGLRCPDVLMDVARERASREQLENEWLKIHINL